MLALPGLASPRPVLDGRRELLGGYTYELPPAYRRAVSRAQADWRDEGKTNRRCSALGRYDDCQGRA